MRASFLGCLVDVLTMADTVELARRAMGSQQRLQHVALNVAKFVNMRFDPVLAADVAGSDVISIDGMGNVWGARALGLPVKSRRDRRRSAHRELLHSVQGSCRSYSGENVVPDFVFNLMMTNSVVRSVLSAFWPCSV